MIIEIEIPKEFEEHFKQNKFKDSFGRIMEEIRSTLRSRYCSYAGRYEYETIEMLQKAFENSRKAYDIDKVVEELEEMIHPKQLYFCKYARGGCKHLDNDDKDCMECVVENAIEIVKQGGVSDDVCEWKVFDNSLTDEPQWVYETACGKYAGEEHTSKAFAYCPCCGKKIKIVGD